MKMLLEFWSRNSLFRICAKKCEAGSQFWRRGHHSSVASHPYYFRVEEVDTVHLSPVTRTISVLKRLTPFICRQSPGLFPCWSLFFRWRSPFIILETELFLQNCLISNNTIPLRYRPLPNPLFTGNSCQSHGTVINYPQTVTSFYTFFYIVRSNLKQKKLHLIDCLNSRVSRYDPWNICMHLQIYFSALNMMTASNFFQHDKRHLNTLSL